MARKTIARNAYSAVCDIIVDLCKQMYLYIHNTIKRTVPALTRLVGVLLWTYRYIC